MFSFLTPRMIPQSPAFYMNEQREKRIRASPSKPKCDMWNNLFFRPIPRPDILHIKLYTFVFVAF